ncbi:TPA: hypothetical protein HA361_03150 [Candidatus Woesearchaeota archaeon]|nr:hypothetical protein [Candidatus Woesearchaeota archaeon]HII69242.1 hypothetical protein [Candidatus Woesearchaeota archaeon]
MQSIQTHPFQEFLGEIVKAPYRDGKQLKVARGRLEAVDSGFVKVVGNLGTLVINAKNIEKMSKVRR